MQHTVEAYLDTWNATDPQTRIALLERHWSPETTYVDPLARADGHQAVSELIAGVHAQFPGFVFSQVDEPDAHHDQVRFRWGLGPAGAEPPIVGFDVMITDEAGRIRAVHGFLDKVPG